MTDSGGTVQNYYIYGAWGEIRGQTQMVANNYGYTGREFSEDGLYYYRTRYMDFNIGRFISEEPYRFEEGTNLYQYVGNNPIRFDDPFGLVTPLTKEEEAKCRVSIAYALRIVVRSSKNSCCRDYFKSYGCNLSELIELTDKNVKFGTIHHCREVLRGGRMEPTRAYGFWRKPGEKSIYICPYACRMGAWTIARTIIHELILKYRAGVGYFEEGILEEAEEKCIQFIWHEEITVIKS